MPLASDEGEARTRLSEAVAKPGNSAPNIGAAWRFDMGWTAAGPMLGNKGGRVQEKGRVWIQSVDPASVQESWDRQGSLCAGGVERAKAGDNPKYEVLQSHQVGQVDQDRCTVPVIKPPLAEASVPCRWIGATNKRRKNVQRTNSPPTPNFCITLPERQGYDEGEWVKEKLHSKRERRSFFFFFSFFFSFFFFLQCLFHEMCQVSRVR